MESGEGLPSGVAVGEGDGEASGVEVGIGDGVGAACGCSEGGLLSENPLVAPLD